MTAPPTSSSSRDPLRRPRAVAVEGLHRRFGRRDVLHDVDLDLECGGFLLVLGDNGAGKTTLLRILATLLTPTAGRVVIAGRDVRQAPSAVRRAIGLVGHSPLLYRDLTVAENLRFYAAMYGVSHPEARIGELVERLELRWRCDDPVGELSRGTRQRAAIARALLHRPQVLLLDEPYAALDDRARDRLDQLLAEESERTTVVLATHEPARPSRWATAAVLLHDGEASPFDHRSL